MLHPLFRGLWPQRNTAQAFEDLKVNAHCLAHMQTFGSKNGRFVPEDEIFHFFQKRRIPSFLLSTGQSVEKWKIGASGPGRPFGAILEMALPFTCSYSQGNDHLPPLELFPSGRQGVTSNVSSVFGRISVWRPGVFFQTDAFSNASIGKVTSSNAWSAFLCWAVFFSNRPLNAQIIAPSANDCLGHAMIRPLTECCDQAAEAGSKQQHSSSIFATAAASAAAKQQRQQQQQNSKAAKATAAAKQQGSKSISEASKSCSNALEAICGNGVVPPGKDHSER